MTSGGGRMLERERAWRGATRERARRNTDKLRVRVKEIERGRGTR